MFEQKIFLSREIQYKLPGIKLGLTQAHKIRVQKEAAAFEEEYDQLANYLKSKFSEQPPSADPVIAAVRRMYYRIGWEPTRYRPSSEALVRRILKDKGLYRINNLVDFGNLTSARFHLPMGLYDLGCIDGDIELGVGKPNESYEGIGKKQINAEGKLILRDGAGVFGNPTADSKRTSIRDASSEVIAVFFCPREIEDDILQNTMQYLADYYQNYTNITIYTEIKKFNN